MWAKGVEAASYLGYFTRVPPVVHFNRRFLLPLGVTGNTSASGAEESRFDPWRGNRRPGPASAAAGLSSFQL
jgi:hypothetical protein